MFRLRMLTAGESHGPGLTVVLEGMPAGLALSEEDIAAMLRRRQTGFGSGGRMKIERDRGRLTGGVMNGVTTGGPIAVHIENKDWTNWADREIAPMTIPRPGHADLTASLKYGYPDLRVALERASARETAARVAAGAIAGRLLGDFGIRVGGYVTAIGTVEITTMPTPYLERFAAAEESEVRCPDRDVSQQMVGAIRLAIKKRDTLGGVFEIIALGVPPGLGSHVHWDRKLEARLAGALMSIPAIKGVEIGPAFANARSYGTEVHDEIFADGDEITRKTNRAAGFEGGITTGEPVIVRAAMKPISTTLTPLRSVDLATGEPALTQYERSDICSVPRAVVVGEAMVALVLADALLEKLGGDQLDELLGRFAGLPKNRRSSLALDATTWRFGYR